MPSVAARRIVPLSPTRSPATSGIGEQSFKLLDEWTHWAEPLTGRPVKSFNSATPIYAEDLSGLPPALIIAAEYDTLRDEAEAYARRLKAAGVATRYICADGMVHGFLQMRGLVPDAQAATEEIARALS